MEPQAPEEETEEEEKPKADQSEENLDQLFSKIDINDYKKKSDKKDDNDK